MSFFADKLMNTYVPVYSQFPVVTLRISSVWNKLIILNVILTQISFRIYLACFK